MAEHPNWDNSNDFNTRRRPQRLWPQPSRPRLIKQRASPETGEATKWQNEPKPKNLITPVQALRAASSGPKMAEAPNWDNSNDFNTHHGRALDRKRRCEHVRS